MSWTPKKHVIVKDESVRNTLHEEGFLIDGNIGQENLQKFQAIYDKHHSVNPEKGGMFYSLYSLDLKYRKSIHEDLQEILGPIFKERFENYKSVINSFIVKYEGEESAFTLHQDSTSLDETIHSPLSVWIPLQDTDLDNGCLCVVPKSHGMFYPYRGISFPTPFENIQDTVRKYLQPIKMKAGDILLFDNRLVHYSHTNNSEQPRLVVMSGLFPKEADFQNCYLDTEHENAPLEIYKQKEDFLLTNTTFFHDCTCRPIVGEKIKEIALDQKDFSAEEFNNKALELGVPTTNIEELLDFPESMHIVSEPREQKGSFVSVLKNIWHKTLS